MALLSPVFLTGANFSTMFKIFVINGWVVIAMTLVLISGGIDLSVAAVMAFVGVVAGQLFLVYGWNIWLASAAGILVGTGIGFVNGFFITRVGLSPFIVTLAMSQIARGTAYVFSEAMPLPLNNVPDSFKFIGRGTIAGTGIQFIIVLFIVVVILFDFLARRSTVIAEGLLHRQQREGGAVLRHQRQQRPHGRLRPLGPARGHRGDLLAIARFNSAPPYGYQGVELDAISAAVIGGTSMNGGEGTILGAVLGIVLLALIQTAINLLGSVPVLAELRHGGHPACGGVHRFPDPQEQDA